MATEIIDDVEHIFAPNPKLQGEHWEQEFPPIQTNSKWLRNRFTGELFPNTAEFARRSDILEAYEDEGLQELPKGQTATKKKIEIKKPDDISAL